MDTSHGLLLVEDDSTTRELLALLLAGDGWAVQDAKSGEAAIACLHAATSAPAVILCDQRLPGLCGAPLAAAMRTHLHDRFPTHGTVLLAMTATLGPELPAGYARVLRKPFSAAKVRETVLEVQQNRSPVSEAPLPSVPQHQASSHSTWPVVDDLTLAQLRKSMPDARLQELFAFALADADDRLYRLSCHAQEGAHELFIREAHALKGSFGVIGAKQLWHLAQEAESLPATSATFSSISQNKVEGMHAAIDQLRLMLVTLFPL